ncbi:23S rRNA (adenine(2503)-C(2))-methyltransferase RlmN [Thermodesulfatator autotrophicus]|uniref:Probable dual-specificity RNA methyltransferase RlmN n=1 Tax=Thermodesulfatator autotrophicus TaxID=1795632 RepID=A0A177E6J2_9BACT|nr:23S rRNA (adenine(2503)-C(2))-methyltransferase RlmN [Thermodesulfatator autotrophicus]OAG27515.1 23S rRNA (adenine(2503)-C2)-methyltransferase [Thermodesulfatator autotrophicus]
MKNSKNLRDLTCEELEALFKQRGLQTYRGRQVFKWLAQPGIYSFDQMTDLPKALRQELGEEFSIFLPEIVKEEVSSDGTRKLVLRLEDKELIESVIIPEADHFTLCVSSQVGCAMGCTFCLTARMGLRRNLKPHEITAQVLRAREVLIREGLSEEKKLRNIVFMGMGEPLANYDNVLTSLHILLDQRGFNFSRRRVTVSTVGLIPQMEKLGRDITVKLAISLHAADEEKRSQLMPINKRYPLKELIPACRRYLLPKGWRITFEYLMLKGVNDSPKDAHKLAKLLKGIPAKINLIPFNEHPALPFKCSSESAILRFQEILLSHGYVGTIRKSKGRDISAACGQLATRLAA